MFNMFNLRTLKAFARAPIIPPQPVYQVVPLVTFRSYAPQSSPNSDSSSKHTEQTGPGAPSTDDIAHSDAAYGGSGANPEESAKKIENEKPGSMERSAANPDASKPPSKDGGRPPPKEA